MVTDLHITKEQHRRVLHFVNDSVAKHIAQHQAKSASHPESHGSSDSPLSDVGCAGGPLSPTSASSTGPHPTLASGINGSSGGTSGGPVSPQPHSPSDARVQVRGYFLVFVRLSEKYGTLIERYTALIEKVSPCIRSRTV
eukprot:SAG31_NODE_1864_length_7036_cov_3.477584_7_plen_140_part_00